MALVQFDTVCRNAAADAIETAIGTSPVLELRAGSMPSSPSVSDTGTLLATLTLPSDWLTAASGGAKALQGTWTGTASAAGDIAYFRLKSSGGTVRAQGRVTVAGGGGAMIANNLTLAVGQPVSTQSFNLTTGNL